jgi:F0F1-type ATP synthase membrane subunit c/vacuolar-type H+-ATPase subunit K
MSILLLVETSGSSAISVYSHYAELGILFAVGLSGLVLGIVSSYPARAACHAVARQPFFAPKIQIMMLLTQSIMQTPLIFAFVVSVLIKIQASTITDLGQALRLIGSGLCIGLGSVGPTIGLALIAQKACASMGVNKYAYATLFPFTIMSQAIVESPLIFALITSMFMLFNKMGATLTLVKGIGFLAAGICMGLGTLMPGANSGKTAAQACQAIALNPEASAQLFRASLISQVFLETGSIYALLVAFFIMILQ